MPAPRACAIRVAVATDEVMIIAMFEFNGLSGWRICRTSLGPEFAGKPQSHINISGGCCFKPDIASL